MYNWNERPTKAESRMSTEDAQIYEVGQYEVSVHTNGDVTYRHKYRHTTDPRSVMPNMEVQDGEIRIPVTDLVGEVLKRLEPRELAMALWDSEEVRDEFIDCLVTRYNERGIGDADRRKLLCGVKEAIHDKSLDALNGKIAALEYEVSKRSFFYHEVNAVNSQLHETEEYLRSRFGDDTIKLPRLRHEDNDPDFKIGGKHWNEARDWWRAEIAKRFPGPVEPVEPTPADAEL